MTGVCLTCGLRTVDVQAHHVAGRGNHSTLVVPVCVQCHQILSGWQRCSGVELDADAPRGELDMLRALLVGVLDLIRLCAQRHPERPTPGAPLAIHTARAISKILDADGAPDRPGRWLPDPTMSPAEAVPVAWPPDTEAERTTEWAQLVRMLAEMLTEPPSTVPAALGTLAEHPEALRAALDAPGPVLAEALDQLLDHVATSHQMIRRLLAVPDLIALGAQDLADASLWISTGNRLLDRVLSVATGGVATAGGEAAP